MKNMIPIHPLSINKAYTGRRFATQDLKDFKSDVETLLQFHPKYDYKKYKIVALFGVKNINFDCTNAIKTFEDCLVNAGVIRDDRYVFKFDCEKVLTENPFIEYEIFEYLD